METRKNNRLSPSPRGAPLPDDYLKLVADVFTTNFDTGLKALSKHIDSPQFVAGGAIYGDEIVVWIAITSDKHLSASTIYASTDFDPKASAPKAEDLLAACVDAIAGLYDALLDPSKPEAIEALSSESLAALDDVPFDWTPVDVSKRKIHVKISKANPKLDQMAEDWLAKNDPDHAERLAREQKATEELFVTGDKAKGTAKKKATKLH